MPQWSLYAFLAALSAALVGLLSKVGITGVDSTVATAIRGAVIALSMGGAALYLGKWPSVLEASPRSLFFIVLAGLFGGLSWLWGFIALKLGGDATAVGAIDRLSIVFLFVLAALFLGEKFTLLRLLGVGLIALGALLVTMSEEQLRGLLSFIAK
jgi:transporter family protein